MLIPEPASITTEEEVEEVIALLASCKEPEMVKELYRLVTLLESEPLRPEVQRRQLRIGRLKSMPHLATQDDIDWLFQEWERAWKRDESNESFSMIWMAIEKNHPRDEIKNYAASKLNEMASRWTEFMKALTSSSGMTDVAALLEALPQADVAEDHQKIGELCILIVSRNPSRDVLNQLLQSPSPLIRLYTVEAIVRWYGWKEGLPYFWKIQKPLIERDLESPRDRIACEAMLELASFASHHIQEALLMLVKIANNPADPEKQGYARSLLK
jgi:hypothetical protein